NALLDGMPAYPRPAGPDRYAFELKGQGPHSLALHFDAAVSAGPDREVRFTVPELPVSVLSVDGPPGAVRLQALGWRGAQAGARAGPAGPHLDADLGRVSAVHLRWREPGGSPPPRPKVQEIGLWDVEESSVRLKAVFRHQLGTAHVSRLEYDVPAGLEVASAV